LAAQPQVRANCVNVFFLKIFTDHFPQDLSILYFFRDKLLQLPFETQTIDNSVNLFLYESLTY